MSHMLSMVIRYFSKIPIPKEDESLYQALDELVELFPEGQRALVKIQYSEQLLCILSRYAVSYGLGTVTPHILRKLVGVMDEGNLSTADLLELADVLGKQQVIPGQLDATDFDDEDLQETDPQVPHLMSGNEKPTV